MAQHGTTLGGAEPCRAITHSKQNRKENHFDTLFRKSNGGRRRRFFNGSLNTDSAIELGNDVLPCIDNVKDLIVDFSGVDDDPNLRIFICPYCAHSFAYKHVLERHVKQIHEKTFFGCS